MELPINSAGGVSEIAAPQQPNSNSSKKREKILNRACEVQTWDSCSSHQEGRALALKIPICKCWVPAHPRTARAEALTKLQLFALHVCLKMWMVFADNDFPPDRLVSGVLSIFLCLQRDAFWLTNPQSVTGFLYQIQHQLAIGTRQKENPKKVSIRLLKWQVVFSL